MTPVFLYSNRDTIGLNIELSRGSFRLILASMPIQEHIQTHTDSRRIARHYGALIRVDTVTSYERLLTDAVPSRFYGHSYFGIKAPEPTASLSPAAEIERMRRAGHAAPSMSRRMNSAAAAPEFPA
jgi:hypothetical protein